MNKTVQRIVMIFMILVSVDIGSMSREVDQVSTSLRTKATQLGSLSTNITKFVETGKNQLAYKSEAANTIVTKLKVANPDAAMEKIRALNSAPVSRQTAEQQGWRKKFPQLFAQLLNGIEDANQFLAVNRKKPVEIAEAFPSADLPERAAATGKPGQRLTTREKEQAAAFASASADAITRQFRKHLLQQLMQSVGIKKEQAKLRKSQQELNELLAKKAANITVSELRTFRDYYDFMTPDQKLKFLVKQLQAMKKPLEEQDREYVAAIVDTWDNVARGLPFASVDGSARLKAEYEKLLSKK